MNLVELLINYLENILFFLLQLQPLILFFANSVCVCMVSD